MSGCVIRINKVVVHLPLHIERVTHPANRIQYRSRKITFNVPLFIFICSVEMEECAILFHQSSLWEKFRFLEQHDEGFQLLHLLFGQVVTSLFPLNLRRSGIFIETQDCAFVGLHLYGVYGIFRRSGPQPDAMVFIGCDGERERRFPRHDKTRHIINVCDMNILDITTTAYERRNLRE